MEKYEKYYNQLKPWFNVFDENEFLNFLEELEIDLSEDMHNFLNVSTQNMNWIDSKFKNNMKFFKRFFNYFKNINFKNLTYTLEKNFENFINEYNIQIENKDLNINDEIILKLKEIERYEIQNTEMILEIRKKIANIGETKFDVNEHQMAKLKIILKEVVDKIHQLENVVNRNNDDIKDILLDNNNMFNKLKLDSLECPTPILNLKIKNINAKIINFYRKHSISFLILMFFLGMVGSWVIFK